jgi:hypothetical protein
VELFNLQSSIDKLQDSYCIQTFVEKMLNSYKYLIEQANFTETRSKTSTGKTKKRTKKTEHKNTIFHFSKLKKLEYEEIMK